MTQRVKIFRPDPDKDGDLKLDEIIYNPGFNHDSLKESMQKKRNKVFKKGKLRV